MTIVNKITTCYSSNLEENMIQTHLDEHNSLGYYLVAVDNVGGWYRFFWAKQVE